jgi:hypothetical protein
MALPSPRTTSLAAHHDDHIPRDTLPSDHLDADPGWAPRQVAKGPLRSLLISEGYNSPDPRYNRTVDYP